MRLNWLIPVPLLGAITVPTLGGLTAYVDDSATGANDGTSWVDAYVDLQDALGFAAAHPESDFEIWVAAGTYKPDRGTGDKFASFGMLSNVALLGGFAGWESDCDQRNPAANETILQGDLLGNDDPGFVPTSNCCHQRNALGCEHDECEAKVCELSPLCCNSGWGDDCTTYAAELCSDLCDPDHYDNSLHVVVAPNVSFTGILDGFTITGGNAKAISLGHQWGGGLLIDGGAPTIVGCTFTRNRAEGGGGVASFTGAEPRITRTTFVDNEAPIGGGMYAKDDGGARIEHCLFSENRGRSGAALRTTYSSPIVTDTVFEKNLLLKEGNPAQAVAFELYDGNPVLERCRFLGHTEIMALDWYPQSGALVDCVFDGNTRMACNALGETTFTRCTFTNNYHSDFGAALFFANGHGTLDDCIFMNNHTSRVGAAIYIGPFASLDATRCLFRGNRSRKAGAGVYVLGMAAAKIVDSIFEENTTYEFDGGAGIYVADFDATAVIERCLFRRNQSVSGGSAIKVDDGTATIRDSLFVGNEGSGGAIMVTQNEASADIIRSTFCGNSAGYLGGAIYNAFGATTIRNCLLWANRDQTGPTEQGQIYTIPGSPLIVNHSSIQGWTGALGGVGNTGDDPLFVDSIGPDGLEGTGDEDFRLLPNSPLINAGDPSYVSQSQDADLDGHVRILCDRVDMGAYEFGIGDFNCDRILELADFAAWSTCMTGPPDSPDHPEPYPTDCEAYDFHAEVDDRIDLLDFAGLQNHFVTP